MAVNEAQIDALANHLVRGLIERNAIRPKAGVDDLVACVVEMLSENFEAEARIEDEAERMSDAEVRTHPGVDPSRLRALIKQRLAKQKNFVL